VVSNIVETVVTSATMTFQSSLGFWAECDKKKRDGAPRSP
jgi:hypothetical protein